MKRPASPRVVVSPEQRALVVSIGHAALSNPDAVFEQTVRRIARAEAAGFRTGLGVGLALGLIVAGVTAGLIGLLS